MKYKDLSLPIMPYLEIEIGGKTFNCTNYISSATIEISGDFYYSISKAVVFIYDNSAEEIEKLLLKDNKVRLKYGIVDAKGRLYIEEYKGTAINFTPSIKPEGIGLSINLVMEQFIKLHLKDKQRSFNDEISNIVSQIASENGLKAEVDKTDVKGVFRQINQTDFEFIRNVLIPRANSNQNDSYFNFWIEGDVLFFKQVNAKKPRYKFVIPHSEESDAPVLNFSPDVNIIGGLLAGEKVKMKKLNTLTKEYEEIEISNESLSKRPIAGERKIKIGSEKIRVSTHGNSLYEELARYKKMWGSLSDYFIKGEMEILGHPFIKPMENVEILVYLINNKTKGKYFYHLSGVYTIQSVKHEISIGSYKTYLEVIKNGALEGQEKAKGILNKQEA